MDHDSLFTIVSKFVSSDEQTPISGDISIYSLLSRFFESSGSASGRNVGIVNRENFNRPPFKSLFNVRFLNRFTHNPVLL